MGGTTDLTGTPAFLGSSSISYSAKDVRRHITRLQNEGIVDSGDFAVSERAAGANMSVDVAAGEAYVQGDTNADEAQYYCRETGTLNATFTASDATNPRIDRVVLEVKNDSEDSSGLNKARIRVIDGTPTGGATLTNLSGAASVPSSCLLLANVLVGAGVTTITTANIQDRRVRSVQFPFKHYASLYTATQETITGTSYALATTPDILRDVRVGENGLLFVGFKGLAKLTANMTCAIFIGSNQLKAGQNNGAPAVLEELNSTSTFFTNIVTTALGLDSGSSTVSDSSDVSTGQILGTSALSGAMIPIFGLAAGSYDVSVQWKVGSGTGTIKERRLWAYSIGG